MIIVHSYIYRYYSKFSFLTLAKILVASVVNCLLRLIAVPNGEAWSPKRKKTSEAHRSLQPRRTMSLVTQWVTQLLGSGWLLPESDGCGIMKWGLPRLLNLVAKTDVETKAKSCGINNCCRYLLLQNSPWVAGSGFKGENPQLAYTANWFLCSRWILLVFGMNYMLSI